MVPVCIFPVFQKVGSSLKHSKEADLAEEEEAVHLPDLVREIFSEFDELNRAKQQSAPNVSSSQFPSSKQYSNHKFASSEFPASKKVSQDSGKPPSGGSSKRTSTEKRPAPLKPDDLDYTSSYWKQVSQNIRKVKQSPQLTAVRKMQAAGRKTEGTKTRKYNAKEEDDNSTATLLYDKSTKSWKLYKNVVNAQVRSMILSCRSSFPKFVSLSSQDRKYASGRDHTTLYLTS